MVTTLLLFSALAATSGAAQPRPAQEAIVPGIIDFGDGWTKGVLTAAEAVAAHEDFKMTIMTFGSDCEREGATSVILSATGATVMVYDITRATHPDVVCTRLLNRLPHTVNLRFEKPGNATIRVWGRRIGRETGPFGAPVVLEHRVSVR
jgi:hypothetical protein